MNRRLRTSELLSMYTRPDSFLQLLPWLGLEDGLFVLHDGSLGAAWKITVAQTEALPREDVEAIYEDFETALLSLPQDGSVSGQVIISSGGVTPDDKKLRQYLDNRVDNVPPLARELGAAAVDRFLEGAGGYWPSDEFRSRRLDIIFCLRFHPATPLLSSLDATNLVAMARRVMGLKNARREPAAERFTAFKEKILGLKSAFESGLPSGLGRVPRFSSLPPLELLAHVWPRLNPGLAASGIRPPDLNDAPKDVTLRCLAAATEPVMELEGPDLDGWKTRVLGFRLLPEKTEPDMLRHLLTCGENLVVSIGFWLCDKTSEIRRLETKRRMAFTQLTTALGDVNISQDVLKEDLDLLLRRLHGGKTAMIKTVIALALTRPSSEQAQRATDKLTAAMGRIHGAAAWLERHVGCMAWLSTLPFAFNPAGEKQLQREWSLPTDNLVHFFPSPDSGGASKSPCHCFTTATATPPSSISRQTPPTWWWRPRPGRARVSWSTGY